jgi:cobalt-zinc-cadmium efflux system outer membrane protein
LKRVTFSVFYCLSIKLYMSRNMFNPVFLGAVCACAAFIHSLHGAEAPSPAAPGSLESIVSDVLAHNPELAFYKAEIHAARGERQNAGTLANPELNTSFGNKRVSVGPVTSDGLAWSASVKQTFEWPGRIALRKAIANYQIKLAELGLEQFETALASRARSLAFDVFAAQKEAAAAREVADRFRSLRETLVQRDPAGLTPLLETRIIEATELTLQRKSTAATLEEQAAQLELNQLRGQVWTNIAMIEPPELSFPPLRPAPLLFAAARTNNFELRMREVELEMQGFQLSLAKNERYPAVSIGPYVAQERTGERETQVGISLSIPLPIWNRNTGKIAAQEARRAQAETLLQLSYRNLERQVREESLAYEARVDALSRWRSDSVEKFKEAAALADRHYRLGAVPITTYVELQKQYLEAVEALLSSKKEALHAAQALQRLTGLTARQLTPDRPEEQE